MNKHTKGRRRSFTAAFAHERCAANVTLRGDTSAGQCMRKRVVGALCRQHAQIGGFIVRCDVCPRTDPHVHCPECGSTEHVAEDCDMEG